MTTVPEATDPSERYTVSRIVVVAGVCEKAGVRSQETAVRRTAKLALHFVFSACFILTPGS
jgi:hypothetical protein